MNKPKKSLQRQGGEEEEGVNMDKKPEWRMMISIVVSKSDLRGIV